MAVPSWRQSSKLLKHRGPWSPSLPCDTTKFNSIENSLFKVQNLGGKKARKRRTKQVTFWRGTVAIAELVDVTIVRHIQSATISSVAAPTDLTDLGI